MSNKPYDLLPIQFQSETNQTFFENTVDQLFKKANTEIVDGLIGRKIPGTDSPQRADFIEHNDTGRNFYTLEPTYTSTEQVSGVPGNFVFYEDLLFSLKSYNAFVNNHNRLFKSKQFTYSPPIDIDKFVNYQNYFWIPENLDIVRIYGSADSTINIDAIPGSKTFVAPNGTELLNGSFVQFTGTHVSGSTYLKDTTYQVEGVGQHIRLLVPDTKDKISAYATFDSIAFDADWDGIGSFSGAGLTYDSDNINPSLYSFDNQPYDAVSNQREADYLLQQRGAKNHNPWSRLNYWYHIQTIQQSRIVSTQVPNPWDTTSYDSTSYDYEFVEGKAVGSIPENAIRATRPIIEFNRDLELYNYGNDFNTYVDVVVNEPRNQIDDKLPMGNPINGTTTAVGKKAIFTANESGGVIYDIVDTGSGNVSFTANSSITIALSDTFLVQEGADIGAEYYWDGTWKKAQFKDKVNLAPKFKLYDDAGVPLDDTTTYPSSTFKGNELFSYKINNLNANDSILNFSVDRRSGQYSSDMLFENDISKDIFNYVPTGSTTKSVIPGYYYAKDLTYDFNGNKNERYIHSWMPNDVPSFYLTFDISRNYKEGQCVSYNKQFFTAKADITAGNFDITEWDLVQENFSVQVVRDEYFITEANKTSKRFDISATPIDEQVDVFVNQRKLVKDTDFTVVSNKDGILFTNTPALNSLVTIKTTTNSDVDLTQQGRFELPSALSHNVENKSITEFTTSDVLSHYLGLIEDQTTFKGNALGINNYSNSERIHTGNNAKIRQTFSDLPTAMLLSRGSVLNLIEALRYSEVEYNKFKNRLKGKVKNYVTNNTIQGKTDSQIFEDVYAELIATRTNDTAFNRTYMLPWGTEYEEKEFTANIDTTTFTTTVSANLEQMNNFVSVYKNDELQTIDTDYTVTSSVPVVVSMTSVAANDKIKIRAYQDSSPSNIPFTPSALGLFAVKEPGFITDTSYTSNLDVICGHDGSYTSRENNKVDDILLHFEKLIYNSVSKNIRERDTISKYLTIDDVNPSYFAETDFKKNEIDSVMFTGFSRWASQNNVDFVTNTTVDSADPFTWNYGELGHWRNIFEYYYGTQTPNTTPWEMFGFDSMPTWWVSHYGSTTVTSSSTSFWTNVSTGFIPEGERKGYHPRYKRENILSLLPVDSSGNLVAPNVSIATSVTSSSDVINDPWSFGDGGPAEQAWKKSSAYPYAVVTALFLTRPGEFVKYYLDPEQILEPTVLPQQLVDKTTKKRIAHNKLTFHGGLEADNTTRILKIGFSPILDSWVSSQGLDTHVQVQQTVQNTDVKLGHKHSGFVNLNDIKLYSDKLSIDGFSTGEKVPSEDVYTGLHTSGVIARNFYSGVKITKTAIGYQVNGYDKSNNVFNILESDVNGGSAGIKVGGTAIIPAIFSIGGTYNQNDIISYNGNYYKAKTNLDSGDFDFANWTQVTDLPKENTQSGIYYNNTTGIVKQITYGHTFPDINSTFDFLISLGRYQEKLGFDFGDYNETIGDVGNWIYTAKQFLFWVDSNPAVGTITAFSPMAEKLMFESAIGTVNQINKFTKGIPSFIDADGSVLNPKECGISRSGRQITITPPQGKSIYGVLLLTSVTEHATVINNKSVFNDTINNDIYNIRQERLRLKTQISREWDGSLNAPGYIITPTQIMPNFENLVEATRNYHQMFSTPTLPIKRTLARSLFGYNDTQYLDNLGIEEDEQVELMKGAIRAKGTVAGLNRILRSDSINTNKDFTVYEEWAVKQGNFGDISSNKSFDLILNKKDFVRDQQLLELKFPESVTGIVSAINIVEKSTQYFAPPIIEVDKPPREVSGLSGAGNGRALASATLLADGTLGTINVDYKGFNYDNAPNVTVITGNLYVSKIDEVLTNGLVMSSSLVPQPFSNVGLSNLVVTDHTNGGTITTNVGATTSLSNLVVAFNIQADAISNANVVAATEFTNSVGPMFLKLAGSDFTVADDDSGTTLSYLNIAAGRYQPKQKFKIEVANNTTIDNIVTSIDNTIVNQSYYSYMDSSRHTVPSNITLYTNYVSNDAFTIKRTFNNIAQNLSTTGGNYDYISAYIDGTQITNDADYTRLTVSNASGLAQLEFSNISTLVNYTTSSEVLIVEEASITFDTSLTTDVPGSNVEVKVESDDRLVAVPGTTRTYAISEDDPNDNVVTIDIDDKSRFVKRPTTEDLNIKLYPSSKFEKTSTLIKNSGFVHKDNVDIQVFDINHFDREVSANTKIMLNGNDVVHMAKGEHDNFDVYQLRSLKDETGFNNFYINQITDGTSKLFSPISLQEFNDSNIINDPENKTYFDNTLYIKNSQLPNAVVKYTNEQLVLDNKSIYRGVYNPPPTTQGLVTRIKPNRTANIVGVYPDVTSEFKLVSLRLNNVNGDATIASNIAIAANVDGQNNVAIGISKIDGVQDNSKIRFYGDDLASTGISNGATKVYTVQSVVYDKDSFTINEPNASVQVGQITSLGNIDIRSTETINATPGLVAGTYPVGITEISSDGAGTGLSASVVVGGSSSITSITVTTAGQNYLFDEEIKIPETSLGGSDANIFVFANVTGTKDNSTVIRDNSNVYAVVSNPIQGGSNAQPTGFSFSNKRVKFLVDEIGDFENSADVNVTQGKNDTSMSMLDAYGDYTIADVNTSAKTFSVTSDVIRFKDVSVSRPITNSKLVSITANGDGTGNAEMTLNTVMPTNTFIKLDSGKSNATYPVWKDDRNNKKLYFYDNTFVTTVNGNTAFYKGEVTTQYATVNSYDAGNNKFILANVSTTALGTNYANVEFVHADIVNGKGECGDIVGLTGKRKSLTIESASTMSLPDSNAVDITPSFSVNAVNDTTVSANSNVTVLYFPQNDAQNTVDQLIDDFATTQQQSAEIESVPYNQAYMTTANTENPSVELLLDGKAGKLTSIDDIVLGFDIKYLDEETDKAFKEELKEATGEQTRRIIENYYVNKAKSIDQPSLENLTISLQSVGGNEVGYHLIKDGSPLKVNDESNKQVIAGVQKTPTDGLKYDPSGVGGYKQDATAKINQEIKLAFSDDYKEPKTSNGDLIEYVDTIPRINPTVSTTIVDRFKLKGMATTTQTGTVNRLGVANKIKLTELVRRVKNGNRGFDGQFVIKFEFKNGDSFTYDPLSNEFSGYRNAIVRVNHVKVNYSVTSNDPGLVNDVRVSLYDPAGQIVIPNTRVKEAFASGLIIEDSIPADDVTGNLKAVVWSKDSETGDFIFASSFTERAFRPSESDKGVTVGKIVSSDATAVDIYNNFHTAVVLNNNRAHNVESMALRIKNPASYDPFKMFGADLTPSSLKYLVVRNSKYTLENAVMPTFKLKTQSITDDVFMFGDTKGLNNGDKVNFDDLIFSGASPFDVSGGFTIADLESDKFSISGITGTAFADYYATSLTSLNMLVKNSNSKAFLINHNNHNLQNGDIVVINDTSGTSAFSNVKFRINNVTSKDTYFVGLNGTTAPTSNIAGLKAFTTTPQMMFGTIKANSESLVVYSNNHKMLSGMQFTAYADSPDPASLNGQTLTVNEAYSQDAFSVVVSNIDLITNNSANLTYVSDGTKLVCSYLGRNLPVHDQEFMVYDPLNEIGLDGEILTANVYYSDTEDDSAVEGDVSFDLTTPIARTITANTLILKHYEDSVLHVPSHGMFQHTVSTPVLSTGTPDANNNVSVTVNDLTYFEIGNTVLFDDANVDHPLSSNSYDIIDVNESNNTFIIVDSTGTATATANIFRVETDAYITNSERVIQIGDTSLYDGFANPKIVTKDTMSIKGRFKGTATGYITNDAMTVFVNGDVNELNGDALVISDCPQNYYNRVYPVLSSYTEDNSANIFVVRGFAQNNLTLELANTQTRYTNTNKNRITVNGSSINLVNTDSMTNFVKSFNQSVIDREGAIVDSEDGLQVAFLYGRRNQEFENNGSKYVNAPVDTSGLKVQVDVNANPNMNPGGDDVLSANRYLPLNSQIINAKGPASKIGMPMLDLDRLEGAFKSQRKAYKNKKRIPTERISSNALDNNAKNSMVLKEHDKWVNGYVQNSDVTENPDARQPLSFKIKTYNKVAKQDYFIDDTETSNEYASSPIKFGGDAGNNKAMQGFGERGYRPAGGPGNYDYQSHTYMQYNGHGEPGYFGPGDQQYIGAGGGGGGGTHVGGRNPGGNNTGNGNNGNNQGAGTVAGNEVDVTVNQQYVVELAGNLCTQSGEILEFSDGTQVTLGEGCDVEQLAALLASQNPNYTYITTNTTPQEPCVETPAQAMGHAKVDARFKDALKRYGGDNQRGASRPSYRADVKDFGVITSKAASRHSWNEWDVRNFVETVNNIANAEGIDVNRFPTSYGKDKYFSTGKGGVWIEWEGTHRSEIQILGSSGLWKRKGTMGYKGISKSRGYIFFRNPRSMLNDQDFAGAVMGWKIHQKSYNVGYNKYTLYIGGAGQPVVSIPLFKSNYFQSGGGDGSSYMRRFVRERFDAGTGTYTVSVTGSQAPGFRQNSIVHEYPRATKTNNCPPPQEPGAGGNNGLQQVGARNLNNSIRIKSDLPFSLAKGCSFGSISECAEFYPVQERNLTTNFDPQQAKTEFQKLQTQGFYDKTLEISADSEDPRPEAGFGGFAFPTKLGLPSVYPDFVAGGRLISPREITNTKHKFVNGRFVGSTNKRDSRFVMLEPPEVPTGNLSDGSGFGYRIGDQVVATGGRPKSVQDDDFMLKSVDIAQSIPLRNIALSQELVDLPIEELKRRLSFEIVDSNSNPIPGVAIKPTFNAVHNAEDFEEAQHDKTMVSPSGVAVMNYRDYIYAGGDTSADWDSPAYAGVREQYRNLGLSDIASVNFRLDVGEGNATTMTIDNISGQSKNYEVFIGNADLQSTYCIIGKVGYGHLFDDGSEASQSARFKSFDASYLDTYDGNTIAVWDTQGQPALETLLENTTVGAEGIWKMVGDYSNNPDLDKKEHLLTVAMLNWNSRYVQFLGFKDHRAYFKMLTVGTVIPTSEARNGWYEYDVKNLYDPKNKSFRKVTSRFYAMPLGASTDGANVGHKKFSHTSNSGGVVTLDKVRTFTETARTTHLENIEADPTGSTYDAETGVTTVAPSSDNSFTLNNTIRTAHLTISAGTDVSRDSEQLDVMFIENDNYLNVLRIPVTVHKAAEGKTSKQVADDYNKIGLKQYLTIFNKGTGTKIGESKAVVYTFNTNHIPDGAKITDVKLNIQWKSKDPSEWGMVWLQAPDGTRLPVLQPLGEGLIDATGTTTGMFGSDHQGGVFKGYEITERSSGKYHNFTISGGVADNNVFKPDAETFPVDGRNISPIPGKHKRYYRAKDRHGFIGTVDYDRPNTPANTIWQAENIIREYIRQYDKNAKGEWRVEITRPGRNWDDWKYEQPITKRDAAGNETFEYGPQDVNEIFAPRLKISYAVYVEGEAPTSVANSDEAITGFEITNQGIYTQSEIQTFGAMSVRSTGVMVPGSMLSGSQVKVEKGNELDKAVRNRTAKFVITGVNSLGSITKLRITDRGTYINFPPEMERGVSLKYDDDFAKGLAGTRPEGLGYGGRVAMTSRSKINCQNNPPIFPAPGDNIAVLEPIADAIADGINGAARGNVGIQAFSYDVNPAVSVLNIVTPDDGMEFVALNGGFNPWSFPEGEIDPDLVGVRALDDFNNSIDDTNNLSQFGNLIDPTTGLSIERLRELGLLNDDDGSDDGKDGFTLINVTDAPTITGLEQVTTTNMFSYDLYTLDNTSVDVTGTTSNVDPMYFKSVLFKDDIVMDRNNANVWVTNFQNAGSVYYENGNIAFRENNLVESNRMEKAVIYDLDDNTTIKELEYIDPFKDAISSQAKINLTYITESDPVVYQNNGSNFSNNNTGELWWDTSTCRSLWYEQGNVTYRSRNWGKWHPGSSFDVYEWTRSAYSPSDYVRNGGEGTPRNNTDFVLVKEFNLSNNAYQNVYYFWVKDVNTVPALEDRTMSARSVALQIEDPISLGLPFYAPVSNTTIMVQNTKRFIKDDKVAFQMNYSVKDTKYNKKHSEWKLYREADTSSQISTAIINKMIDSLCGYDTNNKVVPDPGLNEFEKYGLSIRPKQTMFKDLKAARRTFVEFVNREAYNTELTDSKYKNWNSDITDDTYLEIIDWIKPKFDKTKKPRYVLNQFKKLNFAGELSDGDVVRVDNKKDAWKDYEWSQANQEFTHVRTYNASYKLKDVVFTTNNTLTLATKLRTIINSVFNNLYIQENAVKINELFFALLHYVNTEQDEIDWAFKTTYFNIKQGADELAQTFISKADAFPNVTEFVNEQKPFTSKLRDFQDVKSVSTEIIRNSSSDFDKPPYQPNPNNDAIVLDVENVTHSNIMLTDPDYKYWFANFNKADSKVRTFNQTINIDRTSFVISETRKTELLGGFSPVNAAERIFLYDVDVAKLNTAIANPGNIYSAASITAFKIERDALIKTKVGADFKGLDLDAGKFVDNIINAGGDDELVAVLGWDSAPYDIGDFDQIIEIENYDGVFGNNGNLTIAGVKYEGLGGTSFTKIDGPDRPEELIMVGPKENLIINVDTFASGSGSSTKTVSYRAHIDMFGKTNYYRLGSANSTTISANITSNDKDISVTSTTMFGPVSPGNPGYAFINDEMIKVTRIDGNTLVGVQRGFNGTTIGVHTSADKIYNANSSVTLNQENVNANVLLWNTNITNTTNSNPGAVFLQDDDNPGGYIS